MVCKQFMWYLVSSEAYNKIASFCLFFSSDFFPISSLLNCGGWYFNFGTSWYWAQLILNLKLYNLTFLLTRNCVSLPLSTTLNGWKLLIFI